MSQNYDLPFDPGLKDIVCQRQNNGILSFNVQRKHIHHSPDGFEWGYGGSGPADFALNILTLFIDESKLTPYEFYPITLWDGTTVPRIVWDYHHDLKWAIVSTIPYEGGVVLGSTIRVFLSNLQEWPEGAIL